MEQHDVELPAARKLIGEFGRDLGERTLDLPVRRRQVEDDRLGPTVDEHAVGVRERPVEHRAEGVALHHLADDAREERLRDLEIRACLP